MSKLRGGAFLRGRHAFRITDDGIPRSIRGSRRCTPVHLAMTVGGAENVSSGLAPLDVMLGGGLPRASTTLFMGPSGVGKTTMGLHFLARSGEAEPGLLFGFYETPARLDVKTAGVCLPLGALIERVKSRCSGSPRPVACLTPTATCCWRPSAVEA